MTTLALPESVETPLLLLGDCLDALARLPAESVDVVITDPPAGIGFMHDEAKGRTWDSFAGYEPRTTKGLNVNARLAGLLEPWAVGFVAFMTDVWSEVDRVLKPGGWVCAWALPKTSDLAGLALRTVGWTIQDAILHLFGCLTDDAEILTEYGWTSSRNIAAASLALCYDVERGTYQWHPIQARTRFMHSGAAYRIHGEGVDHTVTPDHRCVDGRRFVTAIEAASQPAIHVPVPDDVHGVWRRLAGHGDLADSPSQDVREGLHERGNPPSEDRTQEQAEALRDLCDALLAAQPDSRAEVLLAPLLRCVAEQEPEHPGAHEGDLPSGGSRLDTRGHRAGGGEALGTGGLELERRPSVQWQGHRDHGPMPCRLAGDGAVERLRIRAPDDRGEADRPGADSNGGRASCGPRPVEQRSGEPHAVPHSERSQAVRVSGFAAATVERCEYTGHMWCVTVPTGAFVARTSAGVFVTGNSGMAKAGDLGKKIDKRRAPDPRMRDWCRWLRAEMDARGVTAGTIADRFGFHSRMSDHWAARDTDTQPAMPRLDQIPALLDVLGVDALPDSIRQIAIDLNEAKGQPGESWWLREVTGTRFDSATAAGSRTVPLLTGSGITVDSLPATPEAERWTDWSSQLAPGYEQWHLARKPTRLTYAAQVLTHGTGALNIGACRVERGERPARDATGEAHLTNTVGFSNGRSGLAAGTTSLGSWPKNVVLTEGGPACPVAELDRQSGVQRDGKATKRPTCSPFSSGDKSRATVDSPCYDGTGGASRFFTRFRYEAKNSDRRAGLRSDIRNEHPTPKSVELMRWLVALLAAKAEHTGGLPAVVLDPFLGSGTTGVACIAEAVRFVGIERDEASFTVARARILAAIGSPEGAAEANTLAPVGGQLGLL